MTGMLNRLIAFVLAITITFISPLAAIAQAAQTSPAVPAAPTTAAKPAPATPSVAPNPGDPWPRVINYQGATISVFQPQVESWAGNELKAYSAVRVKTATKQDTDYGVIWFSARTEVDKVNRMVTLENFVLNKQSFPTLTNNGSAYATAFILDLPWSKTIPLDLLETSLAATNAAAAQKKYQLMNDPPRIIYSMSPAVLALIDGAPVLRPSADNLQKVINSRALLLFDPSKNMYYMALMDGWVEAPTVEGPWNPAKHAPTKQMDKIRQAAETNNQNQPLGNPQQSLEDAYKDGEMPSIYVSTTPAELLVVEGEPQYAQIPGTTLSYVSNTGCGSPLRCQQPELRLAVRALVLDRFVTERAVDVRSGSEPASGLQQDSGVQPQGRRPGLDTGYTGTTAGWALGFGMGMAIGSWCSPWWGPVGYWGWGSGRARLGMGRVGRSSRRERLRALGKYHLRRNSGGLGQSLDR